MLSLLHGDTRVVGGGTLATQVMEPFLDEGALRWRDAPAQSGDEAVVRPASTRSAAMADCACCRQSRSQRHRVSVKPANRVVEAPAIVFHDQDEVLAA